MQASTIQDTVEALTIQDTVQALTIQDTVQALTESTPEPTDLNESCNNVALSINISLLYDIPLYITQYLSFCTINNQKYNVSAGFDECAILNNIQ